MRQATVELGNVRLLKLASFLEDVPEVTPVGEELRGYSQEFIVHPCGSPACAWGFYQHIDKRTRDRLLKSAKKTEERESTYTGHGRVIYVWLGEVARAEFHLDSYQEEAIFGATGCNDAKTGKEAADYIRAFVRNRREIK